MTRRNQRNASWPAKQGATAWTKLNQSALDKTRIALRSPLSVSTTERASLLSTYVIATSPGVIQFHERVFDAKSHFYERVFRLLLHFYERLFRGFRIFMSELETKRLRSTDAMRSAPVCSMPIASSTSPPAKHCEHLTGVFKHTAQRKEAAPQGGLLRFVVLLERALDALRFRAYERRWPAACRSGPW